MCACRFSPHKKQHAYLRRSQQKETAIFSFLQGKFMNAKFGEHLYIQDSVAT